MPKQRAKLRNDCEVWSLDRLRANADREAHSGANDSGFRTRALVRYKNQQRDRAGRISWQLSRRQFQGKPLGVRAPAQRFKREGRTKLLGSSGWENRCKNKASVGKLTEALICFDYFFQPFPSGARAGVISGVRSTSSGVSSQPISIKDFS